MKKEYFEANDEIEEDEDGILDELQANGTYLQLNLKFIEAFGIKPAIILCDLMSKRKYFKQEHKLNKHGTFFISKTTVLNQYEIDKNAQNKIVKMFNLMLVLMTKRKGMPPRKYYWLNKNIIVRILSLKSGGDRIKTIRTLCDNYLYQFGIIKNTNFTQLKIPISVKHYYTSISDVSISDIFFNTSEDSENILLSKDIKESLRFCEKREQSFSDFLELIEELRFLTSQSNKKTNQNTSIPKHTAGAQQSHGIIKHTSIPQSPPKYADWITDLMDYWNLLPNVQHHLKQNTKIRKKCVSFFRQLRNGTFMEKNYIDPEYIKKYKINSIYLQNNHKFSIKEIKRGLLGLNKLFTNGYGYKSSKGFVWPPDDESRNKLPKSLPQLIYNNPPNNNSSTYDGGTSWFLRVLSDPPQKITDLNEIEIKDCNIKLMREWFNSLSPLSKSEDRVLKRNVSGIIARHKTFDWKGKLKHGKSFMGMCTEKHHIPGPFLDTYRKFLERKQEECTNGFRVSVYNIGVGGSIWKEFCERIYADHAIRIS